MLEKVVEFAEIAEKHTGLPIQEKNAYIPLTNLTVYATYMFRSGSDMKKFISEML